MEEREVFTIRGETYRLKLTPAAGRVFASVDLEILKEPGGEPCSFEVMEYMAEEGMLDAFFEMANCIGDKENTGILKSSWVKVLEVYYEDSTREVYSGDITGVVFKGGRLSFSWKDRPINVRNVRNYNLISARKHFDDGGEAE